MQNKLPTQVIFYFDNFYKGFLKLLQYMSVLTNHKTCKVYIYKLACEYLPHLSYATENINISFSLQK